MAMHSDSSNTEAIICQETGFYDVSVELFFASNATRNRQAHLILNGSLITGAVDAKFAVNGLSTICQITRTVYLTVGDNVRIEAYQNSGAALAVQASNSWMVVKKSMSHGS